MSVEANEPAALEYNDTPAALDECGEGWFLVHADSTSLAYSSEEANWDHLVPEDDLIEHAADDRCICNPEATGLVSEETGVSVFFWQHHALDGRDLVEDSWTEEELEERAERWGNRRKTELGLNDIPAEEKAENWGWEMAKTIVTAPVSKKAKVADLFALAKHIALGKPQDEF